MGQDLTKSCCTRKYNGLENANRRRVRKGPAFSSQNDFLQCEQEDPIASEKPNEPKITENSSESDWP